MLNHQTKKKIIDIKEDIVAGMDLKGLDRKYFNTKRKKADFLTKNLQYFNQEELKYLDFKSIETIEKEERIWFALAAYNMGLGHLIDARRLTKNLGGNPDNWLDVKKNLPLLAEKRYYSQLKYGYARGYEAHQYVENIRRYMNSIVNYHRVQENQTTNDNSNNESAVKNSEEIKEKKDK